MTPPKRGYRAGRKKGATDLAKREIKAFARDILESPLYFQRLRARVLAGKAPQIEVLLYHYAYGKPREQVDMRVEGSLVVAVIDELHPPTVDVTPLAGAAVRALQEAAGE